MTYNHRRKMFRLVLVSLLIVLLLSLPASASMNETGAMEAWIKSDLRGNQSTNQTIISIPAEISNDGGLVGLWHMNEGSGNITNDSSGLGNNGTCYGVGGQVCNWTAGRFGYGVLFDGVDDYINTTLTANLSGGGDFTIEAWVKAGGDDEKYVVAQTGTVSPYGSDFIFYYHTDPTYLFWMRSIGLAPPAGFVPTRWNHLAMVWDRSTETYEGFVNGVSIGTSATVSGYSGTGSIKIGTRGDATTTFFDGTIDEVAIYNRSLSAEEVRDHYLGYSLREYSKPTIDSSLVLLMHFDNDTQVGEAYNATNASLVYDYSGLGNSGTNYNATFNSTGGKFNGAFEFDGIDDYIAISDDNTLDVDNGSFTLEAWVYPARLFDDSHKIVIKSDASCRQYALMIAQSGMLSFYIGNGCSAWNDQIQGTSNFSTNRWYHVAGTLDDSTGSAKVYVNGILENTSTITSPRPGGSDELEIGGNSDPGAAAEDWFNGTIDEVAIWNRSLTRDEVREHYHTEGFYGNRTGYLRFHAGNWSLLKDISKWGAEGWHLVGGSWSSSNMELYVDGRREWNYSNWLAAGKLGNYSYIGNSEANNSGFRGVIDEVSIWNRSISEGVAGESFNKETVKYEVLISNTTSFSADSIVYSRLAINNFSQPLYRDDEYTVLVEHFDSLAGIQANNATVYGNFSICPGRFGSGGCFDGDNGYVDYGDQDDYESMSVLTVEVWFKSLDNPSGTDIRTIIAKADYSGATGNAYFIRLRGSEGIRFSINCGAGEGSTYDSGSLPSENQWYHVALTWKSGEKLQAYINGNFEGEASAIASGTIYNVAHTLKIGSSDYGSELKWNGTIDEVRISSVVRIPASGLPNSTHILTQNLSDGTYYWKVRPLNIDDRSGDDEQIFGEWSGMHEFYLDASPPTIYWVRPRGDNLSILGGWFYQNITVVDQNLYWLNCTIYNSTGQDVWNTSINLSGVSGDRYNLYNWTDISTWNYGVYTENCTVQDMTKKKT